MMVNNGWLVVLTILRDLVNGKDDNPYIMENNPNVPNHQPVNIEVSQIQVPPTIAGWFIMEHPTKMDDLYLYYIKGS